jgi:uncharacterized membrane protein
LEPTLTIRLQPHVSLTTRGAWLFFGGCCLASFGVAGLMALRGWWPVLPFAGGEMLLLGWVLRTSMRRSGQMELIEVNEHEVRVERCAGQMRQTVVFPRHWAQVKLRRAASPHHPSTLQIISHGRSFEVGCFLTEEERIGLAQRLRRSIGTVNQSPPLAGLSL